MSTQVSGDSEISIHRTCLLLTCTAICLAECTTDGHWTTKPFSKRCNMYQLFFSSLGPNAWQKQLKRRDNYLTHGLMAWGPFRSSTSWLVVNYLVARKKTGGKPEVLLLSLRIHTPHNWKAWGSTLSLQLEVTLLTHGALKNIPYPNYSKSQ